MEDTYRHKGMRRRLIEQLRERSELDPRVLDVMELLPRHFFLDRAFEEHAYEDKAFPIGSEQTISQPYTVAYQTTLLEVQKRDKILEIGTGSGYQAAILAMLGARVFTVERQEGLYHKTKALLEAMNVGNIRCFFRDGSKGLAEYAPFDKILATAGAAEIPQALKEQIRIGGWLVIPVGEQVQRMYRIIRTAENTWKEEIYDDFRFVPLLGGVNKT